MKEERIIKVSISQSRFLSFQESNRALGRYYNMSRFNLAIEILVISGHQKRRIRQPIPVSISQSRFLSFQVLRLRRFLFWGLSFQSRNRDSCHFRILRIRLQETSLTIGFNLAIEILVISGQHSSGLDVSVTWFQSRNRDSCHFRQVGALHAQLAREQFQSRNRDSCHFRCVACDDSAGTSSVSISQSRFLSFQDNREGARHHRQSPCFNLAIEILVISGDIILLLAEACRCVSISQSRFLSFQAQPSSVHHRTPSRVSISQSRFLSFQGQRTHQRPRTQMRFQSRNRDSCHFR